LLFLYSEYIAAVPILNLNDCFLFGALISATDPGKYSEMHRYDIDGH